MQVATGRARSANSMLGLAFGGTGSNGCSPWASPSDACGPGWASGEGRESGRCWWQLKRRRGTQQAQKVQPSWISGDLTEQVGADGTSFDLPALRLALPAEQARMARQAVGGSRSLIRGRRVFKPLTCAFVAPGVSPRTHLRLRNVYLASTFCGKIKHHLIFGRPQQAWKHRRSESRAASAESRNTCMRSTPTCRHRDTRNQAAVDFRRSGAEELHGMCSFGAAFEQGRARRPHPARRGVKRQAHVDFLDTLGPPE
ncbi:hypothetical protein M2167_007389 [Streptomyces sp. SPB4]|nr:hypothetical protein [Streptomyces sp. SPB4]